MTIDDKLNYDEKNAEVNRIFKEYMSGSVNPIYAARSIQDVIGGISGYKYKSDPGNLTIANSNDGYSLCPQNFKNSKKKYVNLIEDFKAAIRIVARGQQINVEDHNDKGLSTKHYAKEFWQYARAREQEVKSKYAA